MHANTRRVLDALSAHGVDAKVVDIDEGAPTAATAAAALGIEVGRIANSLVFTADGEPLLVMTSGAHRVDTAALGERLAATVKRADPDTVRAATGFPIGGVAPVGFPAPVRVLVDEDLMAYATVWAAAGTPHTVFEITPDDLVRVTGGAVVPVT